MEDELERTRARLRAYQEAALRLLTQSYFAFPTTKFRELLTQDGLLENGEDQHDKHPERGTPPAI